MSVSPIGHNPFFRQGSQGWRGWEHHVVMGSTAFFKGLPCWSIRGTITRRRRFHAVWTHRLDNITPSPWHRIGMRHGWAERPHPGRSWQEHRRKRWKRCTARRARTKWSHGWMRLRWKRAYLRRPRWKRQRTHLRTPRRGPCLDGGCGRTGAGGRC